jgi:uncharacterized protein
MNFPFQLVVFASPSILYMVVRRFRGGNWKGIFKNLAWQTSLPVYYLWSLGVVGLAGGFGWLAFQTIPEHVLNDPSINISGYVGLSLSLSSFLIILLREAFYVALGEEIFFRGFLGGWLMRKLGFIAGNSIQALLFLIPHLLLLMVSLDLWPILAVQAVAGWLLGWLRYQSDSILPGWLAHSLINALGALAVLR